VLSYARGRCGPTAKNHRFKHAAYLEKTPFLITGAIMLHYAVVFFVIALIAAFFGFGGIAVGAASIAKVLFVVFLIGAVVTFLMSLGRRV
jgi:uncharacterized membrane protein YtjA (UPF0391 family)